MEHHAAGQGLAVAQRAMADYRCIGWQDRGATRRLTAHDTLRLHHQQRDWLQQRLAEPFDGPTVVLTHHGPHRGSLAPRFAADWISTAYLSELPPSFFEVPVLWLSCLVPIILLAPISGLASLLLVPYLLWVTFAAYLNLTIVRLNGPFGRQAQTT